MKFSIQLKVRIRKLPKFSEIATHSFQTIRNIDPKFILIAQYKYFNHLDQKVHELRTEKFGTLSLGITAKTEIFNQ